MIVFGVCSTTTEQGVDDNEPHHGGVYTARQNKQPWLAQNNYDVCLTIPLGSSFATTILVFSLCFDQQP
jgi:hypothetical protein